MGVHLVTGDDESLLSSGVRDLVHQLVGGGDRSLMVEEFDGTEFDLYAVVDAALTPPLLTDHRIVVCRGVGRFTVDDSEPLVTYLDDPMPWTELVLVGGGGKIAKAITDALKRCGVSAVETAAPAKAKDRQGWIDQQLAAAGLGLEGAARAALGAWMGEDAGRLAGVIDTLVSAFGTAGQLTKADVMPFLGDAGDVPPWDLTDAIDRGETTVALTLLHRMMSAGSRHPLQIMSTLHAHYVKMLRLDGANARDEASAAAAMGIRPGFPARKALDQYRRLGTGGVTRAIALMAQADLDLRGAKDWPESLVMEVLVARLSKLVGSRR